MRIVSHRVEMFLIAFVAALALGSFALAADWYDNFNDGSVTNGSPVNWQQDLFGLFPGTYDASSGDYALSNPGTSNNDQLVTWVDTASFTNSYIRTGGTVVPGPNPGETGGNLTILGRLDTSTVSAYVLFIDSGANFGLQISLGGALSELVPSVDLPFNATSEVVIELEMVGSQISGYAWQVGTAKPAVPQLTVTDNTLPSGKAGLAYDEDDDNTIGVFRFATAQGTPILAPVCDFNGDVRCDIADMDLLTKEVATHGTEAVFDLTGDSQVTIADMDQWRATAGGLNIGANRPYREGDANLDGAVDGTDFGLWNANKFTVTGQWSKGDFNADNSSDGSDFGIWNANKFTSSDGSLVPEPTSLAFLLTGSLLCAALRLRKI